PITAEKLNYLNEEVIRFGKLINNLNLLKQFESESGKFKAETIFLDDLIVDLYNDFIVDANKKRIRLDYEVEPHHPYRITGD
ncbi:two-component sensor histidine kinase, partial [Alkalihalophilus lindianensis]|nr:two-component sensor histidine kinase [Alkalihalophilus lindianensis]